MRIEFIGGPRDGDSTHQSYAPPYEYYFPLALAPRDYLGEHAKTRKMVDGLMYNKYLLKYVGRVNSKYVFQGTVKFEKED